MTLAQRAAALAALIGLNGVLVTFVMAGFSVLLPVAMVGLVVFGLGVYHGLGLVVSVGAAMVAVPAAVATGTSPTAAVVVILVGLAASAALVVADASWWLRRETQVDPAVVRGLAVTLLPLWVIGAGLGAAAIAVAEVDRLTIWALPAGIVMASALVAAMAWATRRRHRRRGPQADLRGP